MPTISKTPEEYIYSLSEERKKTISDFRKVILKNLPKGFSECINYGMLGYVIPHSVYPDGYHCNPKLPLPFMCLASQKNYISFHHMGLYGDPKLMEWFVKEYVKYCKTKPDIGKGCIRFKKLEDIPLKLIGELVSKISAEDWIKNYEKLIKKKSDK